MDKKHDNSVFLSKNDPKCTKKGKKMTKKVLFKYINNWIPAPCFAKASQGIGYDMQGFGQADFTDFVFAGKCGVLVY